MHVQNNPNVADNNSYQITEQQDNFQNFPQVWRSAFLMVLDIYNLFPSLLFLLFATVLNFSVL